VWAGKAIDAFCTAELLLESSATHRLHVVSVLLEFGPYSSVCHQFSFPYLMSKHMAGLIFILKLGLSFCDYQV
jgi:hypothetical protein